MSKIKLAKKSLEQSVSSVLIFIGEKFVAYSNKQFYSSQGVSFSS